jgi:aminopeptidase N
MSIEVKHSTYAAPNSLFTFNAMKKAAVFILIVVFVSACSIVGVHFKLHNPKRAGKYPEPTNELTLLGDQDSRFRSCYDVIDYDLNFGFSKLEDDAPITGTTVMSAIALEDCDTIQMDLHANMEIENLMQITHWNHDTETKVTASYYREADALFVILPEPAVQSLEFKITVRYKGTPPKAKRAPWRGGFVRKEDDNKNPWWGVACQSEGASMWWACKDVVDDEPLSATISFFVPNGFVAVSNGQLTQHETYEGGEEYWKWEVTYPINLYNITFYIGKYKLLHDTYTSKVTGDTLALNHYVLEQDYDKAKEHFKQLKDHLAFYEEVFGPYPFYDDGYKLVQSPYAGMEHQTAIAYGNKFKNNYLGFDYIILHETAHEWWGNSVTAEDLAEGWIHEGFATYAECLYVERTKGYQAYKDYLRTYRWTIINRRPLVGVYGIRYFNYKDGDIYTKGAWVLHTLRETIGNDSVFFDIIKTFATRFKYRNAASADFQNLVNEKTGTDYKWFFDQYLYNRFVPELEYYQDGDRLYYMWNRDYVKSGFKMPVVIRTGPSQYDTLQPMNSPLMHKLPATDPVEITSNILVKFTEKKKVRRAYNNTRY